MNAESPPAQTVRCTVIVPTYNRAALLADCLDALLTRTVASEPFEIVAVDDGSTDETADVLERFGDRVRAVQRIENGGFARACNDGAATAKGDLLVFLNNDALPSPGWLGALLSYADAHAEAGIVGTVLLFPDGSVQHAGVAIGLDGYPRHLSPGFPPTIRPSLGRARARP